MTVGDWIKEIEAAPLEDLARYSKALEDLHDWPTFRKAYGWTGTPTLAWLLKNEIEKRLEVKLAADREGAQA